MPLSMGKTIECVLISSPKGEALVTARKQNAGLFKAYFLVCVFVCLEIRLGAPYMSL